MKINSEENANIHEMIDDGDDDEDDELFLRNGWPTKGTNYLFTAGSIVRDSYHRKSPTCPQQSFKPAHNLSSADFVDWSCAIVITTTPRRHKQW